jgi:sRNA-binding protein
MATRHDSDERILLLQKRYPAVFFETPQMRRPLKPDIFDDLVADGFACERNLLKASLDWYRSHYGAKRINLQGKEVGTVTAHKEAAAKVEIQRIAEMRKISHNKQPTGNRTN